MFDLVDAVENYPRFLPWCTQTEVLQRESNVVVARLHLRYRGISQAFATRNLKRGCERIDMQLVEGPFRTLSGAWDFRALGSSGCRVSLNLAYEFDNRLLESTVGPVFELIAGTLVDGFVGEAERSARGEDRSDAR